MQAICLVFKKQIFFNKDILCMVVMIGELPGLIKNIPSQVIQSVIDCIVFAYSVFHLPSTIITRCTPTLKVKCFQYFLCTFVSLLLQYSFLITFLSFRFSAALVITDKKKYFFRLNVELIY